MTQPSGFLARFFKLRQQQSVLTRMIAGAACILMIWGLWSFLTAGKAEERIVSPVVIDSPSETFSKFHELWFDHELTRNMFTSLGRVMKGFGLAALVGVPLGVMCGTWPLV